MKTIEMKIADRRAESTWLVRMLDGKWLAESMTLGLVAAKMADSADVVIAYACEAHDRHAITQGELE